MGLECEHATRQAALARPGAEALQHRFGVRDGSVELPMVSATAGSTASELPWVISMKRQD